MLSLSLYGKKESEGNELVHSGRTKVFSPAVRKFNFFAKKVELGNCRQTWPDWVISQGSRRTADMNFVPQLFEKMPGNGFPSTLFCDLNFLKDP